MKNGPWIMKNDQEDTQCQVIDTARWAGHPTGTIKKLVPRCCSSERDQGLKDTSTTPPYHAIRLLVKTPKTTLKSTLPKKRAWPGRCKMANSTPLTAAQEKALISIVRAIGKKRYHQHKAALGIALNKPIPRLSKGEAWQLINRIITQKK